MKKTFIAALLMVVIQSCWQKDPEINGKLQKDIPAIDARMTDWLSKNNMPGLSVAIAVQGRLVYRKGYGLSDVEKPDSVTIRSRFRIASVSKLFTSVAVLTLVEQGKLSLDDRVFGDKGILGTTYGTKPYRPYVTDITVNDLLHHTAGGWGQDNDPAFWNNTLNTGALIDLVLNTVPLSNKPGTRFYYSNFGYILLARVIEKVSGETYPQYVRDHILSKVNATSTAIGGNLLTDRQPEEVKYYGRGDQAGFEYGYANLPRADGAYGWVSTPSDLLRFATAVDSLSTRPDILSHQAIQKMVTTTPTAIGWGWHFGCGWVVEGNEWFWWGTLPGTFSILYRNGNGICIAATSNSRTSGASQYKDLNSFFDIINYISNDKTIPWQSDIDQF